MLTIPTVLTKLVPASLSKRFASRKQRLAEFLSENLKNDIDAPKYMCSIFRTCPRNLHVIDRATAKDIVQRALPLIHPSSVVCENSPAWGLISQELLAHGIKFIRLYEGNDDNKVMHMNWIPPYADRLKVINRDFFSMARHEYIDRFDAEGRLNSLFDGVIPRQWNDFPALSVFGSLTNLNIFYFMMKSIALQNNISTIGRIQMIVLTYPRFFIKLTSSPPFDSRIYNRLSVLFQLFFDFELLGKFPREKFLPWENIKLCQTTLVNKVDPDMLYLVSITPKKYTPVQKEYLLHLYVFVHQVFSRSSNGVIPVVENLVPGSGLNLFLAHYATHYITDLSIFTKFSELTPQQVLFVFNEMIKHPSYEASPMKELVENTLIKSETIESEMNDNLYRRINEDLNDLSLESDTILE